MQIKTITTAAGVNEIDFGNDDSQTTAHFYWFKNLSDSTLYVSAKPNPVAGGDNVAELPAKGATSVETDEGKVYVLGTGKVEIHRTDSKFCPFELPSTGSDREGGSSFPELSNKSAIVFGDSIAAGYGITNNDHKWSNWIYNLGKMSQIENKAISNTTISRIDSNSITDQVISTDLSPYDYIIVAGGVNDWQGQLSLDGFKQSLTTMFDYLARYKASKPYGNIIIISPINMCLANFKSAFGDCNQVLENMNNGVASISIKKYRSIIEEYALRYEFTLIKGSEFDFPTVAGMKSNAYFIDGIHPSERGHYVYAMELLKNLCGYGDYKHFIPLKAHPDFEFPTGEYSSEGYILNAKTYYISSLAPSIQYTKVLLDNIINVGRTKLIKYTATAYFTIGGVVHQLCINSESMLGHLSLYQTADGLYYAYQSHADVTNIDHLEITVYYTINDDINIHS